MGQIQYTTIVDKKCCGGTPKEYTVPVGATPHEIAELTGMHILRAIELYENRVTEDNEKCPTVYLNTEITVTLTKNNCQYGTGTAVTITVPAGKYSSQLSQLDADRKAQEDIDENAQEQANLLGTCITNCNSSNCAEFIVKRTSECGEYRRRQTCVGDRCAEIGEEFFICNTNCNGEICIENCTTCSILCPTGSCDNGYTCVNGVCVPDCNNQPCSRTCRNGTCPPGSTCEDGQCTPIPEQCITCSSICPTGSCPSGFTCQSGQCVPNCTGQPCSRTCRNGECPDCQQCEDGECRGNVTCPPNRRLNTTTCRCEDIPCVPACSEVRNMSLDTDCTIAFVQQRCNGGICEDTTSIRFENKPDGTLCSTGVCRNGVCSSDCVPACQDGTPVDVPGSEGCSQTIQRVDCINANCSNTQVDTIIQPDGTPCTFNGEPSTCLSGFCQRPIPDFCGTLTSASGSAGVTQHRYEIPYTGVFQVIFDPYSQRDNASLLKETYYGSNVYQLVATTGISGINNDGPFDPQSGFTTQTPPSNDINNLSFQPVGGKPYDGRGLTGNAISYSDPNGQIGGIGDWYIGDQIAGLDTRVATFEAETGFTQKGTVPNGDQVIWVAVNGTPTNPERIIIQLSGTQGTAWQYTPQCYKN